MSDRATYCGRSALHRRIHYRRHSLPYGCWTTSAGRDVLFNRFYKPLYSRDHGGKVVVADHGEWVADIVSTIHFYKDATPESEKRSAGLRILDQWDVPCSSSKS